MRFYFDFIDGDRATRDVDGHDLDGVEALRAEMLRALPEILLSDPLDRDERQVDCSVRDGRGAVVCRATVTLAIRLSPPSEGLEVRTPCAEGARRGAA